MQYPSGIEFIRKSNELNVSYNKNSKYNLDVWAISYLLNEGHFLNEQTNTMQLDLRDMTMALRSYFLPNIIKGIQFTPDVMARAIKIMDAIREGEYITYDKGYKFKTRGVKDKKESLLEKSIFENLSKYLKQDFDKNKCGIRQFPANMFNGTVSERNRMTRKFWIDILTVNKFDQLSVIELKAGGNAPLDLFIQAIDYGIFCHLFKAYISSYPFINNERIIDNKVAVYLMAEKFHPAIAGNDKHKGILSLVRKNEYFDLIVIRFDGKSVNVKSSPQVLFDTRLL